MDVVHRAQCVVKQHFDVFFIKYLIKLLTVEQTQQIVRQVFHNYKNIFKSLVLIVHVFLKVLILIGKDDIIDFTCEDVVFDL